MTLTRVSILGVTLLAAACGRSNPAASGATASPSPTATLTGTPTPSPTATPAIVDADGDGLDDAAEMQAARDYLPFVSQDPADACPLGGMLVRVRPHPDDPSRLHILYDHLYQNDCGLLGHVGDDEVFAITADPTKSGPAGILAIRAISHQGTVCERDTECGSLPGMTACATQLVNGVAVPVVFASRDKHGAYADKNVCDTQSCFDTCTAGGAATPFALTNAGEPSAPLTDDLTDHGFVTAANGWTEASLMHFDPWSGANFGLAGNVASDLADPAFLTPVAP